MTRSSSSGTIMLSKLFHCYVGLLQSVIPRLIYRQLIFCHLMVFSYNQCVPVHLKGKYLHRIKGMCFILQSQRLLHDGNEYTLKSRIITTVIILLHRIKNIIVVIDRSFWIDMSLYLQ